MVGHAARVVRLALVLAGVMMAGCAHYVGGRMYESPQMKERSGALGSVDVIIVGNEWSLDGDHAQKVAGVAKEVLGSVKGTTVVAESTKPALMNVADREAIAEGKAAGAKSVCVLSVARYGGMFAIGIPELWAVETKVLYSMRVLDVESGDLLMDSVSYGQTGGPWEVADPTTADKTLRWLLRRDLLRWSK